MKMKRIDMEALYKLTILQALLQPIVWRQKVRMAQAPSPYCGLPRLHISLRTEKI